MFSAENCQKKAFFLVKLREVVKFAVARAWHSFFQNNAVGTGRTAKEVGRSDLALFLVL